MDRYRQVECFLETTRARNRREIVVGVILMAVFSVLAALTPIGSLDFYGNLLLVLGVAVIITVIALAGWPRGANQRSADDVVHWSAEMQRQAKLLRRAPLWYVGPLLPGFVLLFWPRAPEANPIAAWLPIAVLAIALGLVVWLNRRAASDLTRQAHYLRGSGDPQPMH